MLHNKRKVLSTCTWFQPKTKRQLWSIPKGINYKKRIIISICSDGREIVRAFCKVSNRQQFRLRTKDFLMLSGEMFTVSIIKKFDAKNVTR